MQRAEAAISATAIAGNEVGTDSQRGNRNGNGAGRR